MAGRPALPPLRGRLSCSMRPTAESRQVLSTCASGSRLEGSATRTSVATKLLALSPAENRLLSLPARGRGERRMSGSWRRRTTRIRHGPVWHEESQDDDGCRSRAGSGRILNRSPRTRQIQEVGAVLEVVPRVELRLRPRVFVAVDRDMAGCSRDDSLRIVEMASSVVPSLGVSYEAEVNRGELLRTRMTVLVRPSFRFPGRKPALRALAGGASSEELESWRRDCGWSLAAHISETCLETLADRLDVSALGCVRRPCSAIPLSPTSRHRRRQPTR